MFTKTHSYTYRNCTAVTVTHLLMQGLAQVQLHAQAHGYRQAGELPTAQALQAVVQTATQSRKKKLMKRAEQLQKKTNLRKANQFLHLLCVRMLSYGPEKQVARLELSEKVEAIRAARAAWVKARTEAEELRLAYLAEKGDFYTRSL